MIQFLIESKLVDMRCRNDTGFIDACKNKHIDCAKYLSNLCEAYVFNENTFKFIIN